jgi:glycine cleavage system aminomethyltransferase T
MKNVDYWVRQSPFFAATLRAGCKSFSFANHMYQPGNYSSALEEYWKLVTDVTLWDVGTERQVELTGPDALAFADLLTPRDVSKIPTGSCRYTLITSEAGGIINDPILLRLADDHVWLSTSDSDLHLWARGVAVNAGLDVRVGEPDVSPLQIQGPKAINVIDALFRGDVVLAPYRLVETELEGIPVVVSRTGWSGEDGYEIFLRDSRFGDDLWERVLRAGQPFGLAVTGPSDINRVEAGILGYHCDISLDTNPYELGLGRFVELDTPSGFIGKSALERIQREGPKRLLVGIELLGDPISVPFEQRWPVEVGGERVGDVTVALHSPRLEKNIGYAMVAIEHAQLGTTLDVLAPWGDARAMVVEKPFIGGGRAARSAQAEVST